MADGRPPVDDLLEEIGAASLSEDPSPEAVEAVLRRWLMTLDDVDDLRARVERDALADLPGIKAGQVKAALRSRRDGAAPEDDLQGSTVEFDDPKRWPDPVDGEALLSELEATFERFLALPEGAAAALTLWTVHAHAHDAASISPVLALTSPTKRCGKTTALEVLGALVPRPLPASNITAASLFRAVEKFSPTLLIDEADTFLRKGDDLRGVLNSGHSRRSAFIVRTVGDDYEPRRFGTWAPKAVALIGELPDTLADRSIEIRMRRRSPDEEVERLRRDRLDELDPIRRRAWTWAREHEEALRAVEPDLPSELQDRARDNWRPLASVAEVAGGEWSTRARRAAAKLTPEGRDLDVSVQLLEDLRDLFEERGVDRLGSRDICSELAEMEERPWPEFKTGKAITPRQMAKLLAAFDVQPKPLWMGGQTRRGYDRSFFEEPWARYVPSATRKDSKNPEADGDSRDSASRKAGDEPYGSENRQDPGDQRTLTDLTDDGGGSRGDDGDGAVEEAGEGEGMTF